MPIQKVLLARPAFMAPGMTAITRLSKTSMVAIDKVSAANTMLNAAAAPRPALSNGMLEREKPKTNASAIEMATVAAFDKPAAVPMIRPAISPMAQPVRQCSVALAAIALTDAMA